MQNFIVRNRFNFRTKGVSISKRSSMVERKGENFSLFYLKRDFKTSSVVFEDGKPAQEKKRRKEEDFRENEKAEQKPLTKLEELKFLLHAFKISTPAPQVKLTKEEIETERRIMETYKKKNFEMIQAQKKWGENAVNKKKKRNFWDGTSLNQIHWC